MVLKSIKYSRKFGTIKFKDMFKYGLDHLTVGKVISILNGELKATISSEAEERIKTSHEIVLKTALKDKAVYGINTGFGLLASFWYYSG